MNIARTLACLILALCAVTARADAPNGTPRYSWTQPATWSDGTPLTTAQITGYQRVCNGQTLPRINAAAGIPPYQTPASERLAPGDYSCTLAVFAKYTPAEAEVLGPASAPVTFTVARPRPAAVTGLSVD